MKISILFFCCISFNVFAQYNTIELMIEDAIGQKDSVSFGAVFTYGSPADPTLGIDATWGEQNIWNQPLNSLDVRIIQRDSINHHCIRESPYLLSPTSSNLYFPQNIDSKIDYRPFGSYFESLENNFEVLIHADYYPITVRIKKVYLLGGIVATLHLLNDQCNTIKTEGFTNSNFGSDTLFVITDSTTNTLIGRMEVIVPTQKLANREHHITIYPNPTIEQLTLNSTEILDGNITILNVLGQDCMRQLVENKRVTQIDVRFLAKGAYFLRYWDARKREAVVLKFVKD